MASARPEPCPECKSVLCHSPWCQTGRDRLATVLARKGLEGPPQMAMVQKAAVKK